MDALKALQGRQSAARLIDPAPDEAALAELFAAALRAPDHAGLRPWRFLLVRGTARQQLGELFVRARQRRDPAASAAQIEKLRQAPLRAPLIMVAYSHLQPHPKVPEIEQLLSTAAAVQNLLLAAHALGFGAIWRTGEMAHDPEVRAGLGLQQSDRIVGFIYLGTAATPPKPLQPIDHATHFAEWLPGAIAFAASAG